MVWKLGADQERDSQDHVERHVYSELEVTATGAKVIVKGNGSQDLDIPVLFLGQLHNMKKDTNAEVHLIGNGADTDLKYALVTGPRDKHYKSNPGESWGQDPVNPDARVGYTPNGVRLAGDKTIAEWSMGMIEIDVKNKMVYFRVPVKFKETIYATVEAKQDPPAYQK
jgi:hypothetical protein